MKYLKRLWQFLADWFNRHILAILLAGFILGGGVIVLFPYIVVKIPAGYKGVIYRPFSGGVDLVKVYDEGLHILFPFNSMVQYSLAINVHKMDMEVLTSDLLKTKVTVSFQYLPNELTLPMLHRFVGKDYLKTFILPELTAAVRESFGRLDSHHAFTIDLGKVAREVSLRADNFLVDNMSPAGLSSVRLVRIRAFQIESVAFPQDVQKSIEEKLVESSKAESMAFKIDIAKQEAVRKVIEGEGIKKYQDLVNSGLNENYLKHEGIQATLKLAESNNAKVVVFGSSNGGLPLILGDNNGQVSESLGEQKSHAKSVVGVSTSSAETDSSAPDTKKTANDAKKSANETKQTTNQSKQQPVSESK